MFARKLCRRVNKLTSSIPATCYLQNLLIHMSSPFSLHCGLTTPCGVIQLGQHWFRSLLVGTKPLPGALLTNCQCCGINKRMLMISSLDRKITRSQPHLPEVNEITDPCFPPGMISTTCTISVLRNDRKCKYVFCVFPKINSTGQGLSVGDMN